MQTVYNIFFNMLIYITFRSLFGLFNYFNNVSLPPGRHFTSIQVKQLYIIEFLIKNYHQ